eukprot:gene16880-18585_t
MATTGQTTPPTNCTSPPTRTGSWKVLSSQHYEGISILHPLHKETEADDEILTMPPIMSDLGPLMPEKGKYASYMEKEIFEQPESADRTMKGRIDFANHKVALRGIQPYIEEIMRCRRIIMIGAGSSFHCAIATRQIMEELTELPVMVELASDFLDREVPVFRDDVCIFVSQSGETSSTLEALRYCKQKDALVMGITNTINSTLSKETYCGIHVNASVEVGVTSTKAYTSQVLAIIMFALMMGEDLKSKQKRINEIIDGLKELPGKIQEVLNLKEQLEQYGKELYEKKSLLVMGRGFQFATCLEGAFKVKELAYMHSEGILSGELKHGPLALIDKEMPIIMVISNDSTYDKCMNALQQVTARHGKPIIICSDETELQAFSDHIIKTPQTIDCLQSCLNIIPLQLLSMYLALHRGHDVDRPRNLVKTVTNENDH